MKTLKNRIGDAGFFKQNLLRVASASGLAKAFTFISMPVLSRFYAPQDYALFAAFIAVYTIITSFSTLRFEWLVPNAKNEQQAAELIAAGFCAVILNALLYTLVIFMAQSTIENWVFEDITLPELWPIIFLVVLIIGSIQYLINGWLIYIGNLSYYALGLVFQSIFTPVTSILFAILVPDTIMSDSVKLILAFTSGLLISCLILCIAHRSEFKAFFSVKIQSVWSNFQRNKKLLAASVLVSLVNAVSLNTLLFLIGFLFGNSVMGIYAMAQRFVFAPVSVLVSSVSSSFWAETARLAKKDFWELRRFYIRSLKLLAIIAVFAALLLFGLSFFVEEILGPDWKGVGLMCVALMPLVIATVVFSPTNHLVVYEKQTYQLISDTAGITLAAITMVGLSYLEIPTMLIIFFSMNFIAMGYFVQCWLHFYVLSHLLENLTNSQ